MFNKQTSSLTFSDIEEFCRRKVPEGSTLDYKRELPSKNPIEKTVSAMANWHGGWILIGVPEEKEKVNGRGIPADPVGVPKSQQVGERIKNSCLQAIHPAIMPEIVSCEVNDDNEIVVVRVHESDLTPHSLINGNIYVRMDDISHLANDGRKAQIEDIELLLNRRSKVTEKKKRLLNRTKERLSFPRIIVDGLAELRIVVIPTFPSQPIADRQSLRRIAEASRAWGVFNEGQRFTTCNEGVISRFSRSIEDGEEKELSANIEYHSYGGIAYSTRVGHWQDTGGWANTGISSRFSIKAVATVAKASHFYLSNSGFWGRITLRLGFKKVQYCDLVLFGLSDGAGDPIADSKFEVSQEGEVGELLSGDFLNRLITDFSWSAGLEADYQGECERQLGRLNNISVRL